jgi:hypothetical protein
VAAGWEPSDRWAMPTGGQVVMLRHPTR